MTTQTNALAEIALALSMAFFSIMVLTLVSVGAAVPERAKQAGVDLPPVVRVAGARPSSATTTTV